MPPPSQSEIARLAGVSRSTVAWALHPERRDKLKPETREKVEAAARQLNYRPHRYAQIMRNGKSGIIGVLRLPGFSETRAEREEKMVRQIRAAGYQPMMVGTAAAPDDIGVLIDELLDARAEGVIIDGPNLLHTATAVERFRQQDIPIVMVNGTQTDGVPHVRADMEDGMRVITEHVIGHGHKRLTLLAHFVPPARFRHDLWRGIERLTGFCETIRAAGGSIRYAQPERLAELREVEPRLGECDGDGELLGEVVFATDMPPALRQGEQALAWPDPHRTPYELAATVLAGPNRPDALICTNDDWAIGALHACFRAGLRVPDDIAVTGHDNVTIGRYSCPPLTTTEQPLAQMAQTAMDLLGRMIDGDDVEPAIIRLPCRLVARESCAPTRGPASPSA